jgi:hypothetical protein
MTEKKHVVKDIQGNPLNRYKVGIVWQYLEELTVYAHSAEEATSKVKEGHGRHAGATPPVIGEVLVKEIGGFDPVQEEEYEERKKEVKDGSDEVQVISDSKPTLIVPPSGV